MWDMTPNALPALTVAPVRVGQEPAALVETAAVLTNLILNCWMFVGVIGCSIRSSIAGTVSFAAVVLSSERIVSVSLRLPVKRSGASFTDEFDPIPPKQTKEEDPQRGNPWDGSSAEM